MSNKIKPLGLVTEALDEISYDWLYDTHPVLAEAIDIAVRQGITPREIRAHVMTQTQRIELALRCEQAARHIASGV